MDDQPVELTVTVNTQLPYGVTAMLNDGSQVQGSVTIDPLSIDTIKLFHDWLRVGKIDRRNELELLGRYLFRILFADDRVKTKFDDALAKSKSQETNLRLRLSFGDDEQVLSALPWEYLYYPGQNGYFFSTSIELVLSRQILLGYNPATRPLGGGPLSVLLVISAPADRGSIKSEPVKEALRILEERKLVKFTTLEDINTETWYDMLNQYSFRPDSQKQQPPHVIHFIGHGRYHEQRAEIALPQPDGSTFWFDASEFASFFRQVQWQPPLVFLHLGQTKVEKDFIASFAGIEKELIYVGVQAVVATQYPVLDDVEERAAKNFCLTFYQQLATGNRVDYALQMGRHIVFKNPMATRTRVVGTPILYASRGESIIQLNASPTTSSSEREQQATSDVLPDREGKGGDDTKFN